MKSVVCSGSFLALLLPAAPAAAQFFYNQYPADTSRLYSYVEQMPALPGGGGNVAVVAAIQKALVYPNPAGLSQAKGRAVVSIVVEADGSIREAKVVRSPSPSCEQPILAAVRRLPRFVPGRQNGQPVPVVLSLPIAVRLDSAVTAENTPPKSQ